MFRFLVTIVLWVSLSTHALATIGEVTEYKGSSIIDRAGDEIQTDEGLAIEPLDTAITAAGRLRIDFIDDTRVDITEHSRLVIDEFVYDPANGVGKLSLKASLGTVRYASGQIAKKYKQNVKIRTPSATIGVRGTDFVMLVDEIGNSMITLLPSCDTSGNCFVGEITVDSDVGQVVLNQAFQATVVKHRAMTPTPPLVIPLSESDINSILILRKKNPYEEEEEERANRKKLANILDVDFLEFEELNVDQLGFSEEEWHTELDQMDFLLADLLIDILEQLNIALAKQLEDEFKKSKDFSDVRLPQKLGFDATTGITLEEDKSTESWVIKREDNQGDNYLELRLNQNYGYNLNMQQSDWEQYDYRIGSGGNSIDITQRN